MEFSKSPLRGFHIICMYIMPIMSQVAYPGKWQCPKNRLFAISLSKNIEFVQNKKYIRSYHICNYEVVL